MAKGLYILSLVSCLSTAFAVRVPRQAGTTQYTNSSVTTKPPSDPSASGAFCCQVYAPAAALNWWYTNTTIEAVDQNVVTEYLKYNNTVVPTATVTITNSSAADLPGRYGLAQSIGPSFPGIPTSMNAPSHGAQPYDQTILLTGTEVDAVYTTITAPTPFVAFPHVYVFSGTVNDAGRCVGTSPVGSNQASSTSFTEYDVSSVAMSWFRLASYEPIGWVQSYAAYTNFQLSTAYISVYSTTPGEWYTSAAGIKLEEPFITWLADDPVALSAVPKIMSCSPVSGAGAPNVHVRVSFLTTSSAVTRTTDAIFIDKVTTTSAAPASQPPPAGPISTTPPTIQTTEATQIPPKQPSGQPDQPTGQPDQPNPSPSNPPAETSQKPGSPSPGPNDSPPTTTEISLNEPDEQPTFISDTSNQPATQKPTGDSPAVPIQSSDQPVSIGDQTSADLVQITSAGNQASNLPDSRPVNSQAATQEINTDDTVQNTAVATGTSPAETSQGPPPVAIGEIAASQASNGYVVGGQTLAFGGSAIEVSGTTYFLQAPGGTAQVNGQDVQVTTLASPIESAVPIVLGDSAGRPASSGAYVVADQTLSRGGSAIEISGTTYSLEPSGDRIVVNGQATPVSALQATLVQPATVVIGDVTAAPESSGAYYVVAGQTLSPGASAIEISSVTYSLPNSGANVVVNGATSYVNAASTPAPVVLGSITAASFIGGGYIVSSQILSPGGTEIEVSGTTYSLAASGNTVFVDGEPTAMQTAAPAAPLNEVTSMANAVNTPLPVTFGSVTAAPFIAGGYVLASQVLSAGGTAIEVSGTTYSLATSGNTVFIDGKPTTFQNVAAAAPLTIGSQTFTAIAASRTPLVLASQTLVPGGSAITVSGTTYSLPPSVTDSIVVDGQTRSLAQASGIAILSANSQQISFTSLNSGIVVASQTIYPGEAVTINGETLSLASSGGVVVVKSGESTTTEGLGDYIWQGIATSTLAPRTGSAARSTETTSSSTRNGSRPSASTTTGSRTAGTESGNEAAAATTTGSLAYRINVGLLSWMSITTCLVMALLVVW